MCKVPGHVGSEVSTCKHLRHLEAQSLDTIFGHVSRDSSVTLVVTFVYQVCSSQGLLQGPVGSLELGSTMATKKGKMWSYAEQMCQAKQVQCVWTDCSLEILTDLKGIYFHTHTTRTNFLQLFVCIPQFLLFLLRWRNIIGLPRATFPMKHPPIKLSSVPSPHRYAHFYTRLWGLSPDKPVNVVFFFPALCWVLVVLFVFTSNSAGHLGLCHSALKRKGAIWEQQRLWR